MSGWTNQSRFDYQRRVRHSVPVDPKHCSYTLHHVDESGFRDGSWTMEQTELGNRVVTSCGKFYSCLAELTPPTLKWPVESETPTEGSDTGSSFSSGSPCSVRLVQPRLTQSGRSSATLGRRVAPRVDETEPGIGWHAVCRRPRAVGSRSVDETAQALRHGVPVGILGRISVVVHEESPFLP